MKPYWLAGLGLSIVLVAGSVPALAATTVSGEPDATVSSSIDDDLFTAGQTVSVDAPIKGEIFAAGQTVTISNRPDRSIFAAGLTVSLSSGAGYNAFVGGQTVTLNGDYGHDVFVVGSSVVVESGARIRGSLYVTGNVLVVHGTIDGDVKASGQSFTSDATIGKSVNIDASTVSFSGGSIGGDLSYAGSAKTIGLDQVSVKGSTIKSDPSATGFSQPSSTTDRSVSVLDALMALVTMILIGALFILLTPVRLTAISETVRQDWVGSFLTGLVTLMVTPMLIGVALATLIGWPVALIVGFLYVSVLITSSFVAPIILGSLIIKPAKSERPWRALLLGALIVAVTAALPVIGWIPKMIIFVGLTIPVFGASLRWIWTTLRAGESK